MSLNVCYFLSLLLVTRFLFYMQLFLKKRERSPSLNCQLYLNKRKKTEKKPVFVLYPHGTSEVLLV